MMKKNLILIATFAFSFLPVVRCDAAIISWGTPTGISADADVSTTGTLLYAYTFGDTGVPSATVNGVTFAPFACTTGFTSATVGNVTLAVVMGSFVSTNTGTGSTAAPFSNLSTDYQGLLQSATGDVFGANATMTLGGLTNGNSYQVEFWSNASSTFYVFGQPREQTALTAGNVVVLRSTTDAGGAAGGVGQWVTGTFTADATTQAIMLHPTDASYVVNGLQVRTVPEPASTGLLGLGAILLARRRWRRA